jgi:hypothetical protein
MSTLRVSLRELASSFAEQVMDAIRGASLEELLDGGGTGRPTRGGTTAGNPRAPAARPARPGRLARRSPEQITAVLEQVVGLVKKSKGGLRAEQIRADLGLQAKEMPRVLQEGLARKKLKAKGRKRATTYFAA